MTFNYYIIQEYIQMNFIISTHRRHYITDDSLNINKRESFIFLFYMFVYSITSCNSSMLFNSITILLLILEILRIINMFLFGSLSFHCKVKTFHHQIHKQHLLFALLWLLLCQHLLPYLQLFIHIIEKNLQSKQYAMPSIKHPYNMIQYNQGFYHFLMESIQNLYLSNSNFYLLNFR